MFNNERKKEAIAALKTAVEDYKKIGERANTKALNLYNLRKDCAVLIGNVETYLNQLANTPQSYKKEVADVQLSIKEFNYAVVIERDYLSKKLENTSIVGVVGGTAIAMFGPTAAMTIATTFGTASTGTAIASLTGAAASNAALAWLGGGALAAGGGGMVAGNALLALAGPVGWGIAGGLGLIAGLLAATENTKAAEEAEAKLCEIKPIIADLERKLDELEFLYSETRRLTAAINVNTVCSYFPKNYVEFTDDQKLKLGALINSTRAMGNLINRKVSTKRELREIL